jgi:ABC-type phosphate transport system substrate-binding protein
MRRINRIRSVIWLTFSLGIGVAHADVVAVVSAKNPNTSLSKNQIADIFLGKAARFPDGSLAVPVDLTEGAALRNEFYLKLTGKSAAQLKTHWSKIIFTGRGQPPKAVADSAEIIKLLATNTNGIGYIEQDKVDSSVKVVLSPK